MSRPKPRMRVWLNIQYVITQRKSSERCDWSIIGSPTLYQNRACAVNQTKVTHCAIGDDSLLTQLQGCRRMFALSRHLKGVCIENGTWAKKRYWLSCISQGRLPWGNNTGAKKLYWLSCREPSHVCISQGHVHRDRRAKKFYWLSCICVIGLPIARISVCKIHDIILQWIEKQLIPLNSHFY